MKHELKQMTLAKRQLASFSNLLLYVLATKHSHRFLYNVHRDYHNGMRQYAVCEIDYYPARCGSISNVTHLTRFGHFKNNPFCNERISNKAF